MRNMKVVDTREYVGMLKELTEEGKEVSMMVFGSSMGLQRVGLSFWKRWRTWE